MADIENEPSNREEMRILFHEAYSKWKSNKKESCLPVKSDEIYTAIVEAFRKKGCGQQLVNTKEYNSVKRYECLWQNGKEMLQHKGKIVVKESSLFNLLYDIHLNLGHSGRDGMLHELKKDFDSISKDIVIMFVKCCQKCELKKVKVKRGVVVKPILSEDQNSRCQVDLIDYQAKPDGEFKFIMVYQDHLTKFVILRPLKRKTGESVAEQLVKFLSIFDAPQILQSDNEKEFVNSVIKSLVSQWPQCKKIQGKPRHSQSQGSIERANRDIGDILQTMMADEKTSKWASLLPRVQLAKNSRFHTGKMLEMSAKRFKPLEVGQNVRVPVADVDRAKIDARNILGIVIEKHDDFYKVGTKNGPLTQLFARNQLEPTAETFMQTKEVPDLEIRSVRTVAADESVSGGQGHVHCNCKTKCQDEKCKCRREGRLCNSRCNNSLTCTNK